MSLVASKNTTTLHIKRRERSTEAAAGQYRRDGALFLRDVFDKTTLEAAHHYIERRKETTLRQIEEGKSLRVGDKRYMVSFDVEGAMGAPDLVANTTLVPILRNLLGDDMILGSMSVVISQSGAKAQGWHRDTHPLFPENKHLPLPPFCITLMVPLIPFNRATGTTEIVTGTHVNRHNDEEMAADLVPYTRLGDCYLSDMHVLHRGQANRSAHDRPLLCAIYQRRWYRDTQNFSKSQPPLTISADTLNNLPESDRPLVDWVNWMA